MTIADVTKLSCEFVREVTTYLTQVKYVVNPCMDELIYTFSNYKQATSLVDCLTYEDTCELEIIAGTIPVEPVIPPIITTCDGLVDITLTQSSVTCNYITTLRKLSDIDSSFPDIIMSDNSLTQRAYIDVVTKGCSEEVTEEIASGCRSYAIGGPITCNETFKFSLNVYYNMVGLQNHSSGYIKTIRIYQTDSSGILINTPIDVNVAPSNIAAWTSCGLCSGISAAELYFGHATWAASFKELMDNVVYTLQGSLSASWLAAFGANYISIGNKVKHNPAAEWYGINKDDFRIEWVNDLNKTITITSPNSTGYVIDKSYMAENFTLPTICGNVTGRVILKDALVSYSTNSNFNLLILNNLELSKAATIESLVTPTCTKTTLTATYITSIDEELLIFEWYDPNDVYISNELSIVVTEPGIYTLQVTIGEGCLATATITVSGVPTIINDFLITEDSNNLITENNNKLIL